MKEMKNDMFKQAKETFCSLRQVGIFKILNKVIACTSHGYSGNTFSPQNEKLNMQKILWVLLMVISFLFDIFFKKNFFFSLQNFNLLSRNAVDVN
jgi:hypothetical protein